MKAGVVVEGARVLVVDDEAGLLRAVGTILGKRGFEMIPATTAEEAIEYAARNHVDAIILDLELPGISGLEACRVLRQQSDVPILILSVRDNEADKIAALDLGADDYLTKPFSSGELLARLRAMLRRAPRDEGSPSTLVRHGELEIDLAGRTVLLGDEQVKLTRMEFELLALLAQSPDRVLTTRYLVEKLWGAESASNVKALRVHMSHLRTKIEENPSRPQRIKTEPGVGYRFSTRPEE